MGMMSLLDRDQKSAPRPMGTPRELLPFLTSEVYRYRLVMHGGKGHHAAFANQAFAGEFENRNVFFHPVYSQVYRLDAFEPH
jgi:hypothetical protein